MSQPIENYVPQDAARRFRRQAFRVWTAALLVAAVWTAAILLAPVAAGAGWTQFSQPIYRFFSFICHQMDSRSFHLDDHQFAVCARCFGVYFGLLCGFVVYPLLRRLEVIDPFPRVWLFLAMIPIGIDWLLGFFGIWENTHFSRFLTGAILGAACGIFIVPALVEIVRLLSGRKRRNS
jgi:uncharacterized membrane protein